VLGSFFSARALSLWRPLGFNNLIGFSVRALLGISSAPIWLPHLPLDAVRAALIHPVFCAGFEPPGLAKIYDMSLNYFSGSWPFRTAQGDDKFNANNPPAADRLSRL